MRIIFAGTPATAVPALKRLAEDHEIVAVLTRQPAPVGRKRVLTPSPVHLVAEEMGLPVLTPATLRSSDVVAQIVELQPDAVAVVAYGLLVPQVLLDVPKHGWLNLHYSLLPRWRGAAPVQYAIAAQDVTTGTSVFRLEAGLDTGPVADQEKVEIGSRTSAQLLEALSESGAEQLARVFDALANGTASFTEQDGEVTLAPQLSTKDSRVQWTDDAESIAARIRAFTPEPGPWTMLDDQRVKIEPVTVTAENMLEAGEVDPASARVGTGSTDVVLSRVAPAGKNWMNAKDWLRGIRKETIQFEVQ